MMRFSLPRHKRPVLMGFAVLLSLFPLAQTADAPDPMYRSEVKEVRLTFFATDQHNDSVVTIVKSDFAVVDSDGVIRDFRSFGRSPETKLDLVVLIDCSESVLPRFQQEISDVPATDRAKPLDRGRQDFPGFVPRFGSGDDMQWRLPRFAAGKPIGHP